MPPKTTGETDYFACLPPQRETDALLAEAAALQDELFRQTFTRHAHAADADVIDDLAEMDFDDPRYLIVDESPTEENPE